MEWLNGWIKELILIILLAAFTDLLLPNHALQRYVRSVIGLFLLLVLLSPIYELFHHRWSPNQWIQAAIGEPTTHEVQMQSLPNIVKQSNELKTANQKQAKLLTEQQLAVSMQEGIESQYDLVVEQLQVTTRLDENGKPSIDQVDLVLGTSSESSNSGKSPMPTEKSTIAVIKPISPILINLKSMGEEAAKNKESNELQGSTTTQESPKQQVSNSLQEQVKQYIAREWQIKQSQIHLK
jgi:stage III sporulation protein AF